MDEFKIKIKTIAVMFFCCYALASCFASTVKAEDITTGNLLPNGTGAASNLQSVDTTVPNVQSSCSSFTSVNTTCTNSNWNYQEVEVGSTSTSARQATSNLKEPNIEIRKSESKSLPYNNLSISRLRIV